jgi:ABC-2 type transport system ATP-binding protein
VTRLRTLLAVVLARGLLVPLVPAAADAQHSVTQEVVESFDGTRILISVYKPARAASEQVPVILHSHGWGGSRTTAANAFAEHLNRGYAVVSISQRGFGGSGGRANVTDPEFEGRDIIEVIDHMAEKDWVLKDVDEAGDPIADDPVLFAIGGSYGGGYQLVTSLLETETREGGTRFDAIAPEIAWFDLSDSLAPSGVVRSAWASLLYAAGAANIVEYVHPAFAYGLSSGQWPDGTVPGIANLAEEFFQHGPSGFVDRGVQLEIPALIYQGSSDNLFNLNQGIRNFEETLSDAARARSAFIAFNGGHALPNVAPIGFATGSNACTKGFGTLALDFFDAVRAGGSARDLQLRDGSPLPAYSLTDVNGTCVTTDTLSDREAYRVGIDAQVTTGTATTTGAGAIQHLPVASGPLTVSGIPQLAATVTTVGADQRVFFALSVGTSPANARVVQNNMLPLRELLPVVAGERTIDLPGVAVDVPAGQTLYLTVSPVSDMSFGHGSIRTPGAVALQDMTLHVPVVRGE